ncbi:MAG: hypothetical protein CMM78_03210 [Rhodospirillaceae bacterium]|jgi:hypothetical protein|uniref:polysaccharide deacetylase family protein n=1 Tax=Hwanghaeella sp. 1Z406 TaxID=3402811 RepID=UPI000C5003CE|nr:hypothetical protein [Rhodospirillales bacterium]MAX47195.1 hypothetical protein [Rhodospirillaceae bacterium]|tara:strand:+ start:49178 stop:49939 length:762 start_codon:yes stop_codon:yes gene_type:complete
MTGWDALRQELDLWHRTGTQARLWWRDDDARAATPVLDHLLTVAQGLPLALAVIPVGLEPSLIARMRGVKTVSILPHGYAHSNHEPADRKKAEFGASRDVTQAVSDLRQSLALLQDAFGDQVFPLFVPPWNRIAPEIVECVTDAGLRGVSTFTDRTPNRRVAGLNTHVDILDWKAKKQTGRARFLGQEAVLSDLVAALARRRVPTPGTDTTEAVGLLTHHLEHDQDSWDFLARLVQFVDEHPGVGWISAPQGL